MDIPEAKAQIVATPVDPGRIVDLSHGFVRGG